MSTTEKTTITVEAIINAPVEKAWKYWTSPEHITKWNNASPDWHTPKVVLDLKQGGTFNYRMEAKDESFGFDFYGTFDVVKTNQTIEYTLGDERIVQINFIPINNTTKIVQSFEAETINSIELQKGGWQAILDNFKSHTETN